MHERIAEETIVLLPAALKDFLNENKRDFLKGVTDEKELFDRALEQKDDFSVDYLRNLGIERFYFNYKRVQFLMERKPGDRTTAYEAGKLVRSASDLLEPLPQSSAFRFIGISANRIFFLDDAEQNIGRYRYFYVTRKLISSFPKRISSELEHSSKTADVIYKAYRDGATYRQIERQTQDVINRTINFCADTLYTLYEMKNRVGRSPFDASAALGLDRFRRGDSDEEFKIAGPKPPVVQSPAKTQQPEIEKNGTDKKENDNTGEESKNGESKQQPGLSETLIKVLLGKGKIHKEKTDGEESSDEEKSEEQ